MKTGTTNPHSSALISEQQTAKLRAKGKAIGLTPLVENLSQTAIAGPYGIFSPYRMLDADNRYGPAAWDWAALRHYKDFIAR